MNQRFVYVGRLKSGDEVELRHVLEHLPRDAFADNGIVEYASYVGSGYCVLQFALPDGDFQEQFERFANDPRAQEFHRKIADFLVEGEQIAELFSPGGIRFHAGAEPIPAGVPSVTSSELPLAYLASHWPH